MTTDFHHDAWFGQDLQLERADLCAWTWGTTYSNGVGVGNMNLGGKDFLIPQNWVNSPGGNCAQNLGHAGFYVDTVMNVPSPITTAGTYTPSGGLTIPASGPVTYQWIATYSNNVLPPDTSAWVTNGVWSFSAPAGSYTINLWVTPKDVLGPGLQTQFSRVVCTGGNGPVGPNVSGGC